MSRPMTTGEREAVVREARALIGVPFFHAGRTEAGVDCVGLLVLAARRAGLDPHDNPSYSPVVDGAFMRVELAATMRLKDLGEDTRQGDVMLFRVGRHVQHLALVTETGGGEASIVHAYQGADRVVEQRLDRTWWLRLVDRYEWRVA